MSGEEANEKVSLRIACFWLGVTCDAVIVTDSKWNESTLTMTSSVSSYVRLLD